MGPLDPHRSYFFSPCRQNRGRVTFPFPPVERGAEAVGVLQKIVDGDGKTACVEPGIGRLVGLGVTAGRPRRRYANFVVKSLVNR
jgi:hypothetical protein